MIYIAAIIAALFSLVLLFLMAIIVMARRGDRTQKAWEAERMAVENARPYSNARGY